MILPCCKGEEPCGNPMKYLFVIALVILGILSFVAYSWKPETKDPRVQGLDFFFQQIPANSSESELSYEDVLSFIHKLDTDKDSSLTAKDFEKSSEIQDTIEFLLRNADDNVDGKLTEQEIRALFSYLDRDKDGRLTVQDYPEKPQIELIWCSDDNPVRREQIRLFNRMHPEYHLRLDPQNSSLEKIIVQSLAGVGPDVFDCYNAYALSTFARAGVARDITEDLRAANLSIDEAWPSLRPVLEQDGKVYGALNNAAAPAIWYNKRIFDEAGVPYPSDEWTWEECIDICRRLTVRNVRGQITRYGIIGYWDWKIGLFQHGASIFNPEGTRCVLDKPEAIAAMQFMKDLIYKYEVMPTPQAETALASAGGWGSGIITLFAGERGAMAIGGRWWLCILRDSSYAHLKLGAVSIPALRLPDGTLSRRTYAYGRSTLVNAASKNIEGALTFVKFLFSPEWSALINRQADALGPIVRFNYTDDFMHNPQHPEEDYNAVWRTALENADTEVFSPYVNGQVVDRIMLKQTDLLRMNLKSAQDAMLDATKRINEAIIENLARDRVLREKYYQTLKTGAAPAWEPGTKLPWEEGT